jgi:5-formyltetrahydrofolate cyclo-ligase
MSGNDVLNLSKIISNTLISLDVFEASSVVALYSPFRNEVDLMPLLNLKEKRFVFPKVKKGTKKLEFHEIRSLNDLAKGNFGILEPVEETAVFDIEKIDLFAVPGVAFSQKCERIGYGGGYYDATLPCRSSHSKSVGIAYDLQIVNPGFSTEGDQPVDIIITEKRIFKNISTI